MKVGTLRREWAGGNRCWLVSKTRAEGCGGDDMTKTSSKSDARRAEQTLGRATTRMVAPNEAAQEKQLCACGSTGWRVEKNDGLLPSLGVAIDSIALFVERWCCVNLGQQYDFGHRKDCQHLIGKSLVPVVFAFSVMPTCQRFAGGSCDIQFMETFLDL